MKKTYLHVPVIVIIVLAAYISLFSMTDFAILIFFCS